MRSDPSCPYTDAQILAALRAAGGPVTSRQLAASLADDGRPAEPWIWWRVAGFLEGMSHGRPGQNMPVITFFYQGGWWYVHRDHANRNTLAQSQPSQAPVHALRDYWEHGLRQERRDRGAAHRPRAL